MSQIYKSLASGPTPPGILTTLVADDVDDTLTEIVQPNPTNVNATASKIQLNGDNGIQTYALTALTSGDTNVLQIGFTRGFVTTVGAVTTPILSITVPTNSAFTMQIIVSGLADNNDALGGSAVATFKNIAGTVSIVDILDFAFNGDLSLVAGTFTVTAAGAVISVNAVGVAGRTINWGACTPGTIGT